jgi:Right handed beta helix region
MPAPALVTSLVVTVSLAAGCAATPPRAAALPPASSSPSTTTAAARGAVGERPAICAHPPAGPARPPVGAVVVDPAVPGDLSVKTNAKPAGTTFWLAPGTHSLGGGPYMQVIPKDGDVYLGAPGAVLDGHGITRYAFTQHARNVTIRYLTVRGFNPPRNEGVVNHDSGDGWVIRDDVIRNNHGAGLLAGAHQQVIGNCLADNGQYGMNAFQAGGGITKLLVQGNEIVGNNADDLEATQPGCGCTAGIKFWAVDGADVRDNWVHGNRAAGLWADTNNNDFLIENNWIEDNDSEAVNYEISYNLVLRNNTIRRNAVRKGTSFATRKDEFPVGTVYVNSSGGDARVQARTDRIEIYGNLFDHNWSGITAFEDANRFCNSPVNTSRKACTRVGPDTAACVQPGISAEPLYSDCRWKTQRVTVHDNTFVFDPSTVGCPNGLCGWMALLANTGTKPDWSPYRGSTVSDAVTFRQDNLWAHNTYLGPWRFMVHDTSRVLDFDGWRDSPYRQDTGSTS